MAYIRNGWMIIKWNANELVLDEFDDDAIDVEAESDKAAVRKTTKGKPIFSMLPEVDYRLTIAVPPKVGLMQKVLDFQNLLKKNDYPDLTFTTYEKIDGKIKETSYSDANWVQDLNYDSIMKSDAPTGTFQLLGTRINEVIK